VGIMLLFVILFVTGSLLSYSPAESSLTSSGQAEVTRNIFGPVGAGLSGLLVFLFGLGSFWIPVLLLLAGLHYIRREPPHRWVERTVGGFFLVIFSGALLSLVFTNSRDISLLGASYSSGGLAGFWLKLAFTTYLNNTGAGFVLFTLWIIALTTATGISVMGTLRQTQKGLRTAFLWVQSRYMLWKGKRQKAKKREQTKVLIAEKPKPPPKIKKSAQKPIAPPARQESLNFPSEEKGYTLPPISLLEDPPPRPAGADQKNLQMQARLLEKKLEDFGVHGKVVEVSPGPVITTFEYEPAPGIKINRITNLAQDLTMALRAMSVRIVGPIPGKAAVGIEVPNAERELVCFKEIVSCPEFSSQRSKLTLCLGKDIIGLPTVADLSKMPHLLIAGATGSGKSVALNTMIASILFKYSPDQVKFVMIDPKRIELSTYDGIPHLICPVVCDAKKATNALFWAVREMESRYEAMALVGARNISGYNQKIAEKAKNPPSMPPEPEPEDSDDSDDSQQDDAAAPAKAPVSPLPAKDAPPPEPLPFVVIIIDELADLMMVASRDVEVALARLAQMARAAGLHLILATQRPSVDVLTGTIKANFPARVAFQVSSRTDSRTILDSNGAEDLLGRGDMLFMPPGAAKLQRLHGAYISDEELAKVLAFIRQQSRPQYDTSITDAPASDGENGSAQDDGEYDEKYDEAVAIVTQTRQASISMIQRRLRIGYNRAARIIEIMEREGVVGPSDGVKPREVLVPGYDDK